LTPLYYSDIIKTVKGSNTTHGGNNMKNTIYTPNEYMAQGFSKEEVPFITRHDTIFNKMVDGIASEEEQEEMFRIQMMLGL
jgi:hypothetical protein